jgi:surfeit locus 1 family protein
MLLLMLPVLLGLGAWQLQRAAWKAEVLATLEASANAPPIDLRTGPIPEDADFRQVRITLACAPGTPARRAGRSLEGVSGYAHLLPCEADGDRVWRNLGWTARADPIASDGGLFETEGRLVRDRDGDWVLFEETSDPPLTPSAPPSLDTIPDNHTLYAIQWFSFAAILAIFYMAYVIRWRRQLAATAPDR